MMTKLIQSDPWKIIQVGFHPDRERFYQSVFSIGNGKMGQRANFEEDYTGDSMQGSYIAGLYYPDKTRVGWWKNGYPEYFAKVINSVNWIGVHIKVDGELLDFHHVGVSSFRRELDMQHGTLTREANITMSSGTKLYIKSIRFCSMHRDELGCIHYEIKPLNSDATIECTPYLNNGVRNEDSNYDEVFWDILGLDAKDNIAFAKAQTNKLFWTTATACKSTYSINGNAIEAHQEARLTDTEVGHSTTQNINKNDMLAINKYVVVLSNLNHELDQMKPTALAMLDEVVPVGFNKLKRDHANTWLNKWKRHDIVIDGDVDAQQAIRFNIFQLNQTYTGADSRLNIGPKGFTGEKYGGSTYWDTEAYCLPYYLGTAEPKVARNLLLYRHNHLPAAIANAKKLGFNNGAALYPMVTMNGEECHNEWEITFEEIHRNGAIAYAIYDYVRYTGDWTYIPSHGLEVLIAICRFWAQRITFSKAKNQYVMLGVTGPNEYENNINNNWYTNYLAVWCLDFTQKMIEFCSVEYPEALSNVITKTHFNASEETHQWKEIASNMYFPRDETRNIFLQQDGFLDKELKNRNEIPVDETPIWKHWSWDRILRSCYIKQADVLQGMFLFEDDFDIDTIARHFDFYEPMTVHDSSLSPCVHSIHAALLNRIDRAYELYLRTARLDLDNMNNDTDDGCHITSMAGTWMSIVKGFGGFRIKNDIPHFTPRIPHQWKFLKFNLNFRNRIIKLSCSSEEVHITVVGEALGLVVYDQHYTIQDSIKIPVSHVESNKHFMARK